MKVSVTALVLGSIALVVLCLAAGAVGGGLTRHLGNSSYTISYADFISVMLTALSVLLALVSIFFAVLGVIGWTAISRGVRARVEELIVDGFKHGNALHQLFEREADKARFRGVEAIDPRDLEEGQGKADG